MWNRSPFSKLCSVLSNLKNGVYKLDLGLAVLHITDKITSYYRTTAPEENSGHFRLNGKQFCCWFFSIYPNNIVLLYIFRIYCTNCTNNACFCSWVRKILRISLLALKQHGVDKILRGYCAYFFLNSLIISKLIFGPP